MRTIIGSIIRYLFPSVSFDAAERYTVESWIYHDDMVEVIANEEPLWADKRVVTIDSQATETEWFETVKIRNAAMEVIGYRMTISGTKPTWVPE